MYSLAVLWPILRRRLMGQPLTFGKYLALLFELKSSCLNIALIVLFPYLDDYLQRISQH